VTAGRVILIVLGSIGVLFGLAVMAGGGFLLWADRTQREDGYLTTPSERFATPTYALTRTRLEVETNGEGWVLNESWFGKVRIRGESPAGKTLFIGIGPQAEVARYLGPVAHANVQDLDFDPFRVTYLPVTGGAPQAPPTEQSFWAASASGIGTQTLTWKVRDGDWSAVLMNADGSRGVTADVDLGAKLSFLLWVAIGLLLGGVLVTGGSAALVVAGRAGHPPTGVHRRSLLSRAAGPGSTNRTRASRRIGPNTSRPAERSSSVRAKPETGLLDDPGAYKNDTAEHPNLLNLTCHRGILSFAGP
jgi:hypothetical protein